jgi:hypothetical protein
MVAKVTITVAPSYPVIFHYLPKTSERALRMPRNRAWEIFAAEIIQRIVLDGPLRIVRDIL